MRTKLTVLAALLPLGLICGQAEAVTYTLNGTTSEDITASYEVFGRGSASVGVIASAVLPQFSLRDPSTLADYNVAATVANGSTSGQAFAFQTNAPGVTVPTRPGGGINLDQDMSLVTLHIIALARNVSLFSYSVRITFPDSATVTPLSVAVPGPIAGAGLPFLVAFVGAAWWRRRRATCDACWRAS